MKQIRLQFKKVFVEISINAIKESCRIINILLYYVFECIFDRTKA